MALRDMTRDKPASMFEDREGRLYVVLRGGERPGLFAVVGKELQALVEGDLGGAAAGRDRGIYFTLGKGVFFLDPDHTTTPRKDLTASFGGSPRGARWVSCMRDGSVWVEGCPKLRTANGAFREAPPCPLPGPSPVPVADDQFGNGWGLFHIAGDPNQGRIVLLPADDRSSWKTLEQPIDRDSGQWQFVVADEAGFVWVAGEEGILRLDPRKPELGWIEFQTEGEAPLGKVTALSLSPSGRVLAGFATGGLYELDVTSKDKFLVSEFEDETLKSAAVQAVHTDRGGSIRALIRGRMFRIPPCPEAWQKSWDSLARLPAGNHDIVGVEYQGKFYVAGGLTSYYGFPARTQVFDELLAYDPETNAWSVVSRMSHPRCYNGLAELEGRLWVVGGYANLRDPGNRDGKREALSTVEIYDVRTGKWQRGQALDERRSETLALAAGGRIYVVGGVNEKGEAVTTMLSIGPGETTWRPEPALPVPMRQYAGCVLEDKLYVCVGKDGFFVYDPANRVWESGHPQIPQIPRAPLMAAHKGEVWVMAGQDLPKPTAVYCYSPKTRTWRPGPDLPTPQAWAAGGEIDGKLIAVGGAHWSEKPEYFIFEDRVFVAREG